MKNIQTIWVAYLDGSASMSDLHTLYMNGDISGEQYVAARNNRRKRYAGGRKAQIKPNDLIISA